MIRQAALSVLATPPVLAVLRRRALKDDPVTILCYHTLAPDTGGADSWTALRAGDFRAQLSYLRRAYDIVDLETALEGSPEGGRGRRPRAVLTFDDGDRGLHAHLLPILRETPVPVTIYVATEQIEEGRPFWFDRVVNALQGAGEIEVGGLGRFRLPGGGGKAQWAAIRPILQALKATPPADRERLADLVVAQGGPAPSPALGPMTKDQLADLAAHDGVTIGAHSHGHELLDQIPLAAAEASVARSRDALRDWTGQEVRHFAFPNGNHSAALRDMVMRLGFASAAILEERTAPRGCDPFALPRLSVGRYDDATRLKLRLVGI